MSATIEAVTQNKNDIPWNKHVRQKQKPGDWAVSGIINVLLLLTIVAVLYPLWFVVIASFSNPNAVAGGEVLLLPKDVTFAGYAKVFANQRIWQGYLNTIIYSVVGTAVNMAVTIPCAFALSRREFKPRRVIMFLFTVTMFIAGGLIPNYLLYKSLGINNTMWVFILPGAVSVYNVIVARSFFETSIPEELFDAAQIDGLSYFGYFFKIVLPLSSAILAVIGLYYFVGHWNDFMTGLIYITDDTKQPLQVVLQQLLLVAQGTGTNVNAAAQQQAADQIKFGIIIVSTLPLLVLYPFLQKYFNKGVMLGAVKGSTASWRAPIGHVEPVGDGTGRGDLHGQVAAVRHLPDCGRLCISQGRPPRTGGAPHPPTPTIPRHGSTGARSGARRAARASRWSHVAQGRCRQALEGPDSACRLHRQP